MGYMQSTIARKKGRLEQGFDQVHLQGQGIRAFAIEDFCSRMYEEFYSRSYFNGHQSIPVVRGSSDMWKNQYQQNQLGNIIIQFCVLIHNFNHLFQEEIVLEEKPTAPKALF